MPTRYLELPPNGFIPLPPRGGLLESVHVIDEESVLAINAALATGRPLLVRGEPGTGKSQLARAAAEGLGRAFLSYAVDGRTETRDLLYSIDAVARLAEAQVMGARKDVKDEEVRRNIELIKFVQPGPLWWAFDWPSAHEQAELSKAEKPDPVEEQAHERGAVVLVDEIDKADAAIPNGLLDALGSGRFAVPGRAPVARNTGRPAPLVVITTNEERSLPDAFLRRCLVLHLKLPEKREELVEVLIDRGGHHFPKCAVAVREHAAQLLATDREKMRQQDLAPPGLAEYIDLLHAVTRQREGEKEQIKLLDLIAKFALNKHPPEPGQ